MMIANEMRALSPLNSPLVEFCHLAEPEALRPLLAPIESIVHSSWLLPGPSDPAATSRVTKQERQRQSRHPIRQTAASLWCSQTCDLLAQGSDGAVKLRVLRENIRRLDRSCPPALFWTQGNSSVWCIVRKSYLRGTTRSCSHHAWAYVLSSN